MTPEEEKFYDLLIAIRNDFLKRKETEQNTIGQDPDDPIGDSYHTGMAAAFSLASSILDQVLIDMNSEK